MKYRPPMMSLTKASFRFIFMHNVRTKEVKLCRYVDVSSLAPARLFLISKGVPSMKLTLPSLHLNISVRSASVCPCFRRCLCHSTIAFRIAFAIGLVVRGFLPVLFSIFISNLICLGERKNIQWATPKGPEQYITIIQYCPAFFHSFLFSVYSSH